MKQFWYGLWQEMYYYLAWPLRFLIELVIAFLLLIVIWKFCKWLITILHLKEYGIKLIVFFVTEFDRLAGKNAMWAMENDEKIINWGRKRLSEPSEKWYLIKGRLKKFFIVFVIIIYILAVLPELPFINIFDSDFKNNISGVKDYFQAKEAAVSKGYEKYPHLFKVADVKNEKGKDKKEGNIKTVLKLKRIGKRSIKLYKKPSASSKVILKVEESDKVIYKNQYKKKGKISWLKVYLPKKKAVGWIDGKYVKAKQKKELLKT